MLIRQKTTILLTLFLWMLLTACGGGNSDSSQPDTTPPVITLNGDSTISQFLDEIYDEMGASATDNMDSSVTVVISGSVDSSTLGDYTVTYTATDSAGNSSNVTRTVTVILPPDTAPPVITLNGDSVISIFLDETYDELGATATDDRDTSVEVLTSGAVDTSTLGDYIVTYTATDIAGNTSSITRTITVILPPDQTAPTGTINFPIDSSVAVNETVMVRGTVNDASEVVEVKVNGASVSFSERQNKQAKSSSTQQSNDTYTYSWQAELALENGGSFDIKVSTTDIIGNSTDNAAQASVMVPIDTYPIEYDEVNNTFIGRNYLGDVSIINPADNTFEKLKYAHPVFQSSTKIFKDSSRDSLISIVSIEGQLKIYTMDLAGDSKGIVELVYSNMDLLPNGEILLDVKYSQVRNTVALSYISYISPVNLVLEFNFDSSSVRTLLSRESELQLSSLVYIGDSLFVASLNSLEKINLETLTITNESDLLDGQYILQLSGSDSSNELYGLSWEMTYKIDLNSKQLTAIAEYDDDSLEGWSQPSRMWTDKTRNRLLVIDFNVVNAVDLGSGNTSKFYSNAGRGEGYRLEMPRVMDISSDDKKVYVFDDGGGSAAAVFAIDVATGDRSLLTKVDDVIFADDIVLDEANNRAFLMYNNKISEVQLTTGVLADFASNDIGTGVYLDNIQGMVLDGTKGALYVTDATSSNVISIDLETKNRTLISSPNNEGGLIPVLQGVSINSEENVLYVLDQKQSELYQIDIETGSRVKILDSCTGIYGDDILTDQTHASRLFYSDTDNSIYIHADTLLKLELNTGICTPFGGHNIWSNFDIKMNSKNQILSTFGGGIRQVDFDSGSEVIISKY
jgi:hypothetical protein